MELKILYKGEEKGKVVGNEIIFYDIDFNPMIDENTVSIEQEEDEWGNVFFNQVPAGIQAKLMFLQTLGFEISEEK